MKIIKDSKISVKPKNYERRKTICSHLCYVSLGDKLYEYLKVVYEVEPSGSGNAPIKQSKNKWKPTYCDWGTFKEIIEIPEIFSKLDEEDYTVYISKFVRDNVLMPCISEILIKNIVNYRIKEKANSIIIYLKG